MVGSDFKLMSDPVAPYTFEQALRFGAELEKLDYYWYEEPLFDENFCLRELTRILDIPIIGTEVIAKHPYSVVECISTELSIWLSRCFMEWRYNCYDEDCSLS